MIVVVRKKSIFIALVTVLVVMIVAGCGIFFANARKVSSMAKKVIVIDAGHGGIDKGVIGSNGTCESEKNLEISHKLKALLEDSGFIVVMTRENDDIAKNIDNQEVGGFKNEDFQNRKKIIQNSGADMLISIHCNKFPSETRRGIQVFYNNLSEDGKNFAVVLQESLNALNAEHAGRMFTALSGDYYMLNCTEAPSVIIECGFLSNPEDERLLCTEEYLDELVYSVYAGVVAYVDRN